MTVMTSANPANSANTGQCAVITSEKRESMKNEGLFYPETTVDKATKSHPPRRMT